MKMTKDGGTCFVTPFKAYGYQKFQPASMANFKPYFRHSQKAAIPNSNLNRGFGVAE